MAVGLSLKLLKIWIITDDGERKGAEKIAFRYQEKGKKIKGYLHVEVIVSRKVGMENKLLDQVCS